MVRKLLFLVVVCLAAPRVSAAAHRATGRLPVSCSTRRGRRSPGASVTVEIKGRPARTSETGADGRFSLDEATWTEGTLRVRANGFAESVTTLRASASDRSAWSCCRGR